jgi:hypothetical protein
VASKCRGPLQFIHGQNLKKIMNMDLIVVKCQKFRGQIENSHFNQENDVISKTVHRLFPQESFQL